MEAHEGAYQIVTVHHLQHDAVTNAVSNETAFPVQLPEELNGGALRCCDCTPPATQCGHHCIADGRTFPVQLSAGWSEGGL